MTNLHNSGNSKIIGFIISAIFVGFSALLLIRKIVRGSFSLQTSRLILTKRSDASITMSDPTGLHVLVDLFALDSVFAFQTSCRCKGAMALNEFFW